MTERDSSSLPGPPVWRATDAMHDFITEELDPRARGDLLGLSIACIVCMGVLGIAMSVISSLAPDVFGPFMWLGWGLVMTGGGALLGFLSGVRFVRSKLQKELIEELLEPSEAVEVPKELPEQR